MLSVPTTQYHASISVAPLLLSAAQVRYISEESALTNGTLHLIWNPRDHHCREYWLQQRFPSRVGGILSVLKSQWNWKGIAQGTIGSHNLLFRRVGYAFPWVLISSDNPRWDNLKFLYSQADEGTLHW